MSKNQILEGFKFSIGIILGLVLFFGIIYATGFHSANEILSGAFLGNYTFNGNINMSSGTLYFQDGTNQTSASNGWTLIESVNVTTPIAYYNFLGIDDTYDIYKIEFLDVVPTTDDTELIFRWGNGGILTANYAYEARDTIDQNWATTSGAYILMSDANAGKGIGSNTYEGASGEIKFYRSYINTYQAVQFEVAWHKADNTGPRKMNGIGNQMGTPSPPDRFQIAMASGNINSGKFYLYGLKK